MRMRAPARTSRFLLFALLNDLVFGMIGDEGGGNVVGEVGSSSVWNMRWTHSSSSTRRSAESDEIVRDKKDHYGRRCYLGVLCAGHVGSAR